MFACASRARSHCSSALKVENQRVELGGVNFGSLAVSPDILYRNAQPRNSCHCRRTEASNSSRDLRLKPAQIVRKKNVQHVLRIDSPTAAIATRGAAGHNVRA